MVACPQHFCGIPGDTESLVRFHEMGNGGKCFLTLDSRLLVVRPASVLQFEVGMTFAAAHDICVDNMISKKLENRNVRKVGKELKLQSSQI